MNRRNFIKNTTLASFIVPSVLLGACEKTNPSGKQPAEADGKNDFELEEFTLDDLRKGLNDGKYTSHSITQLYLDRIEAIDKNNAKLNSIIDQRARILTGHKFFI